MTALLDVQDMSLGFHGVCVLPGVSLTVERRSITMLIGPNRLGNLTLFNALSGLYRPNVRHAWLGGAEITGLSLDKIIARGMVHTFELVRGFPKLTVFQHLARIAPYVPLLIPAFLTLRANIT